MKQHDKKDFQGNKVDFIDSENAAIVLRDVFVKSARRVAAKQTCFDLRAFLLNFAREGRALSGCDSFLTFL